MDELRPLSVDDLKRMLGERDIIIEQLTQALSRLSTPEEARDDPPQAREGGSGENP